MATTVKYSAHRFQPQPHRLGAHDGLVQLLSPPGPGHPGGLAVDRLCPHPGIAAHAAEEFALDTVSVERERRRAVGAGGLEWISWRPATITRVRAVLTYLNAAG